MSKYYKKEATSFITLYAYVDSDDYPEIFDEDGEIIDEDAFHDLDSDDLDYHESYRDWEDREYEFEEVTEEETEKECSEMCWCKQHDEGED
jgi:hypothetical protein|tara:strand:+ start:139 stop:411 length:273 start_codon:yes stop_codon:yes gene_type:complete